MTLNVCLIPDPQHLAYPGCWVKGPLCGPAANRENGGNTLGLRRKAIGITAVAAYVTQDAAIGHLLYMSSAGRRDSLFKLANKLFHGKLRNVHVGRAHPLGVGDESSALSIRSLRRGVRFTVAVAVERVKHAVAVTMLFIRGENASESAIRGATSVVANRMHAALG